MARSDDGPTVLGDFNHNNRGWQGRVFSLTTGTGGDIQKIGRTSDVAFTHEHAPREVVEAWLDANEDALEGVNKAGVYIRVCKRYDEAFKQAARDAWEERGWSVATHGGGHSGGYNEWSEFVRAARRGEDAEVPTRGDGE